VSVAFVANVVVVVSNAAAAVVVGMVKSPIIIRHRHNKWSKP